MNKVLGNKKAIFVFLFPALLIFVVFVLLPIFMSIGFSLTDWKYGNPEIHFVGLDNFRKIFMEDSGLFVRSVVNSLKCVVVSVVVMVPMAFILASILAAGLKGEKFFMTVLFLPVVISGTVIGQLWLKIYNFDYGILNTLLRGIGLDRLTRDWLGNPDTAMWAVIFTCVWQNLPYQMLLLYAAVKNVSSEVLESAALDGAVGIKRMWHIILPMVKPVMEVCFTFAVINSFKLYDIIVSMTNGGPMQSTEVPSTQMIMVMFNGHDYGRGSSMAVFIAVECLVCTLLIQKLMKD